MSYVKSDVMSDVMTDACLYLKGMYMFIYKEEEQFMSSNRIVYLIENQLYHSIPLVTMPRKIYIYTKSLQCERVTK